MLGFLAGMRQKGPLNPPWGLCFGPQIRATVHLSEWPLSGLCQKAGIGKWDFVVQWGKNVPQDGRLCVCVCVCVYVRVCKNGFLSQSGVYVYLCVYRYACVKKAFSLS